MRGRCLESMNEMQSDSNAEDRSHYTVTTSPNHALTKLSVERTKDESVIIKWFNYLI